MKIIPRVDESAVVEVIVKIVWYARMNFGCGRPFASPTANIRGKRKLDLGFKKYRDNYWLNQITDLFIPYVYVGESVTYKGSPTMVVI